MEKCWANLLQDCDGVISREYIVSKSLFISTQIDVKGFSWCKDETKRVGLANITKKCLCKKHNSNLSPLDQAASYAFDTLRKQTHLSNVRTNNPNNKRDLQNPLKRAELVARTAKKKKIACSV